MALGGGGGGGGSRGIRAGAAFVELGVDDKLSGKLKSIGAKFMNFGKLVTSIGAAVVTGGLALGITGIVAAAGPLLETIQDLGKMQDVAEAFGITGRAASGLFGVLAAAGGEFKENLEGVIQFSGTIEKAMQDVGQGKELFDGLAISAKEIKGLAVDEQFYRVLGAIREMPQPLQEAKLALLGGTDSMKQWQKLLSMSEQDVRSLADKLAFNNAELRQAAEASRAYQAATLSVTRAWQQIAVSVAPVVKEIAGRVERAADGFTEWFKGRSAGSLWDEVVAQLQIKLAETFQWLRNQAYGLFDYLTEGRNFDPLFKKLGEFFKSLVNYFSASLTKVGEQIAKNLGIDPNEQKRFALRQTIAVEGALGKDVSGYQRALDTYNDPAKLRAMKDLQLKQALEPDQKAFDEMLKAYGGLAVEFDKEMAALAAKIQARKEQFADIDADLLDPLKDRLAVVQFEAQWQQMEARFRDLTEEALSQKGGLGESLAKVSRSLATFGGGGFLTQRFAVQSADKDIGKKLDKQVGLLGKIEGHLGKFGPLVATN